jgi:hypothetical protein
VAPIAHDDLRKKMAAVVDLIGDSEKEHRPTRDSNPDRGVEPGASLGAIAVPLHQSDSTYTDPMKEWIRPRIWMERLAGQMQEESEPTIR